MKQFKSGIEAATWIKANHPEELHERLMFLVIQYHKVNGEYMYFDEFLTL